MNISNKKNYNLRAINGGSMKKLIVVLSCCFLLFGCAKTDLEVTVKKDPVEIWEGETLNVEDNITVSETGVTNEVDTALDSNKPGTYTVKITTKKDNREAITKYKVVVKEILVSINEDVVEIEKGQEYDPKSNVETDFIDYELESETVDEFTTKYTVKANGIEKGTFTVVVKTELEEKNEDSTSTESSANSSSYTYNDNSGSGSNSGSSSSSSSGSSESSSSSNQPTESVKNCDAVWVVDQEAYYDQVWVVDEPARDAVYEDDAKLTAYFYDGEDCHLVETIVKTLHDDFNGDSSAYKDWFYNYGDTHYPNCPGRFEIEYIKRLVSEGNEEKGHYENGAYHEEVGHWETPTGC